MGPICKSPLIFSPISSLFPPFHLPPRASSSSSFCQEGGNGPPAASRSLGGRRRLLLPPPLSLSLSLGGPLEVGGCSTAVATSPALTRDKERANGVVYTRLQHRRFPLMHDLPNRLCQLGKGSGPTAVADGIVHPRRLQRRVIPSNARPPRPPLPPPNLSSSIMPPRESSEPRTQRGGV